MDNLEYRLAAKSAGELERWRWEQLADMLSEAFGK